MHNKLYVSSHKERSYASGHGERRLARLEARLAPLEPRGFYGFYARLRPEVSQLVAKAHEAAKAKYGAPLSHPLLLEELLGAYLTHIKGTAGSK